LSWLLYRFLFQRIITEGIGSGFFGYAGSGFFCSTGGAGGAGSAGLPYSLLFRGGGLVSPNSKLSTSFSKLVLLRLA